MSNVWGKNIRLSVFGESHGSAVGMVLDGLPPGFAPDWAEVARNMKRRAPGNNPWSTPREESDEWEILSGFFQGKATGTPLCAVIKNQGQRGGDYTPNLIRPGHADFTAYYKYRGNADYRGGGHFSGRLTAPLVLAGSLAGQILRERGIMAGARIINVGGVKDAFMPIENIMEVSRREFPVYDEKAAVAMQKAILQAKADKDSLGGIIECAALGIPIGLGEPFFASLESVISAMMFSIPAVKGIEFGDGFALADKRGSEANDQLYMDEQRPAFLSNHSGGINGGLSNGQPLVFRIVVKPTPTIGREQTTVDIVKGETVKTAFKGRHDPCIVPRAAPVAEAGLALCLWDCLLDKFKEGAKL
ncbi:MAG: chorismate synthase [Syntrophomonadaceae bacterium]|jgi:chorismate synthase|nr:chorismate synthase [Syntrophomonadaceae bacterium]